MRIFGLSLAMLWCLSVAGLAQQTSSDAISADQKDVGKLQTRILK